jgi:hypothetical protein
MTATDRGQGLIQVFLWFLALGFSLWLFILLAGHVLEPIREFVMARDAVSNMGYDSGLELLWPILTIYAPLFAAVGGFVLIIIYAVFREQFQSRRAPRP